MPAVDGDAGGELLGLLMNVRVNSKALEMTDL
jgi:hypothetical protein